MRLHRRPGLEAGAAAPNSMLSLLPVAAMPSRHRCLALLFLAALNAAPLAAQEGIDVGKPSALRRLVPAEQIERQAGQEYEQLKQQARTQYLDLDTRLGRVETTSAAPAGSVVLSRNHRSAPQSNDTVSMGCVSVGRSRSSTRSASSTTSPPMPSPGMTAIFTIPQG